MLARAVAARAPAGVEVDSRNREGLDVRDSTLLAAAIRDVRPDWVFNCAGFTNVEAAEQDPHMAFAVNAHAVGMMGRFAASHEVRVLHFSTDYVFDGANAGYYHETDVTGPLNVYGESKLAGEEQLRASGAEHLIIRTQWLFGLDGRSFVGLMCDRAEMRQPTRAVHDETGCCTYVVDLAEAAWQLLDHNRGLLHLANRGKVSRYELARRVFERHDATSLLTSCSSAEFGASVRRPINSALSVSRAEQQLGRAMATWESGLSRYLDERSRCAKNHKNPASGASKNA